MNTEEHEIARKTVGRIVKLHENGWGFIISPTLQFTRVFFHWTALQQNTLNFTELRVGMMVKFYPQRNKEYGTRAYKLEVVDNDFGNQFEGLPGMDRNDIERS